MLWRLARNHLSLEKQIKNVLALYLFSLHFEPHFKIHSRVIIMFATLVLILLLTLSTAEYEYLVGFHVSPSPDSQLDANSDCNIYLQIKDNLDHWSTILLKNSNIDNIFISVNTWYNFTIKESELLVEPLKSSLIGINNCQDTLILDGAILKSFETSTTYLYEKTKKYIS